MCVHFIYNDGFCPQSPEVSDPKTNDIKHINDAFHTYVEVHISVSVDIIRRIFYVWFFIRKML